MPIAGAPRTTIVRIASATSAAERHSTSTSSRGSRRWSRNTTRSSSRRKIRSGSSIGGVYGRSFVYLEGPHLPHRVRPMRPRPNARGLIPALVVLALAAAGSGGHAAARQMPRDLAVTRTEGATTATLVYRKLQDLGPSNDYFAGARIRISRNGKELFRERVALHPRLAHGSPVQGDTKSFAVRDLDGDGEPEVMLELDSGGAHCCAWTRLYRYQ